MADRADGLITSALARDPGQGAAEIRDFLLGFGCDISAAEVESRISGLKVAGTVIGSAAVDPAMLPRRVVRIDLVTFRTSQALPKRLDGFMGYLRDAPFVIFAGRTRGGHDWITAKSFPSAEMADGENDAYRNVFGDIIQACEVYDLVPQAGSPLRALACTGEEHARFLRGWAPPPAGRE